MDNQDSESTTVKEDNDNDDNDKAENETGNEQFDSYNLDNLSNRKFKDVKFLEQSEENKNQSRVSNLCYCDLCELGAFEVALEGLDGITIEALWTRISTALDETYLTDNLKKYFWDNIRYRNEIDFYLLDNDRPKLILYNRYQNVDDESGIVLDVNIPDIYEHCPVNDKSNRVLGSCKSFYSRKLISYEVRDLSWQEAFEKYENKLVIVASQSLRKHSLFNDLSDPLVELLNSQYCVFERIGRSRKLGELTQGKMSLQCAAKDPKTLFYYRKFLEEEHLIIKQAFLLKNNIVNLSGNILHLTKFYNEKKTKVQILTEKIVSILKEKPNFQLDYIELRRLFSNNIGIYKLLKLPQFHKFVRTDVTVPYREVYPDAPRHEWKLKKKEREKTVRILELINPELNVASCWNEEDASELSSDEDTLGEVSLTDSTVAQIYNIIYENNCKGLTVKDLLSLTNLDFYTLRAILKSLANKNAIQGIKIDRDKQRVVRYYIQDFVNEKKYETVEQNEVDEELSNRSNEHLSQLLGIDKYHLESSLPTSSGNEFQDSLKTFLNISNKSGMLVSKLRKDLNYHKVNKKKNDIFHAESGTVDTSLQSETFTEENVANSSEIYKDLLNLESDLCKNSFDFDACQQECPVNLFPYGTNNIFSDICFKIATSGNDTDYNSLQNNKIARTNNKSSKINKLEPAMVNIVSFKILFENEELKDIRDDNLPQKIFRLLSHISSLIKSNDIHSLFEIEENLKNILTELFQYNFYELNPDISPVNFQKFNFDNDLFEETINRSFKRKINTSDEDFSLSKRRKVDVLVDETDGVIVKSPPLQLDEEMKENVQGTSSNFSSEDIKECDINTRSAIDFRLMGVKPVFIKKEVDKDDVEIFYYESTPPKEYATEESTYREDCHSTKKKSIRTNAIIQTIREEQIYPEIHKLCKFVDKFEKSKGDKSKIDRKTLQRILGKLVFQGFIKIIKIVVKKMGSIFRVKYMACLPSVNIDHYLITSVVDHIKIKLSLISVNNIEVFKRIPRSIYFESITSSLKEFRSLVPSRRRSFAHKQQCFALKYNRFIAKTYGYSPKYVRAMILHKILFNLIYAENKNSESVNINDVLHEANVTMDEDAIKELPPLYADEVCPEMFIAPLPKHVDWPRGWVLISDVLLRLPVSIFFKLINVSFVLPNVDHYLKHPVLKYLPVKYLPANILQGMLLKRKYLFSFHDNLILLCHMGLMQFGPQRSKQKDQLMVYFNRQSSLLDTTSSKAGYHQIEDKEYNEIRFVFTTINDVDSYWHNLWTIVMQTPLNQRYAVLGQTIQIDNVHFKPSMVTALMPKTPRTALENDNGEVPGDRRGAAGFDSVLWTHLKRNWFWVKEKKKTDAHVAPSKAITGVRKRRLEEIKVKPVKFSDLHKMQLAGKRNISTKITERKKSGEPSTSKKPLQSLKTEKKRMKKEKKELRKILPRRLHKRRKRVSPDEIDHKILIQLKKTRSVWTKSEDDLLMLLRTAAYYFCEQYRIRMVPLYLIRDVLHKLSPISYSKTTQACQRRMALLQRNEMCMHNSETHQNMIHNNEFITKFFGPFREKVLKNQIRKEYYCAYVVMAAYVYYNQNNLGWTTDEEQMGTFIGKKIVNWLDSPRITSSIKLDTFKERSCYQEPVNELDILTETIKTIIHSCLSCKTDKMGWSFQMFQVYQRYPDPLLRRAVTDLSYSEMISMKKRVKKSEKKSFISSNSFQQNFRYVFLQNTAKFPMDVYPESATRFEDICTYKNQSNEAKSEGFLMKDFTIGNILCFAELTFSAKVTVNLNIPQNPLSLNPNITDHSELIKVLALRYKRLMTMNDNSQSKEASNTNDAIAIANSAQQPATSSSSSIMPHDVETITFSRVLSSVPISTPSSYTLNTKNAVDNMVASICKNLSQEEISDRPEEDVDNLYKNLKQSGNFGCDLYSNEELNEEDEGNEETESSAFDIKDFDINNWLESRTESEGNTANKKDLPVACVLQEEVNKFQANSVLPSNNIETLEEKSTPVPFEPDVQGSKSKNDISSISVKEIMKQIAENESDQDGEIPGPTKLIYLLKRGLFPDDTDTYLDRFDRHYIINCPEAYLHVEEENQLYEHLVHEFRQKCTDVINKIKSSAILPKFPCSEDIVKAKMCEKGLDSSLEVFKDVVRFVKEHEILGVPMTDIAKKFCDVMEKSTLLELVRVLIDCNVFFVTGVTILKCVHYDFCSSWVCKSFALKRDGSFRKDMDIEVRIFPWIRVTGHLNKKILDNWLHLCLTNCITHPMISIDRLTTKLTYLKHVEVYHLVKYLQDLDCVSLVSYELPTITLTSTFEEPRLVAATEFHEFKDIFIQVHKMAVVKLGMFIKTKS